MSSQRDSVNWIICVCSDLVEFNGGSVSQHFRHAGRELRGIVAKGYYRIGLHCIGVVQHSGKGILAGLLAEFSVGFDIAADNFL